jgi:hypothetical protein
MAGVALDTARLGEMFWGAITAVELPFGSMAFVRNRKFPAAGAFALGDCALDPVGDKAIKQVAKANVTIEILITPLFVSSR